MYKVFLSKDRMIVIKLNSQENLFHMDIMEKKPLVLAEK